MGAELRVSFKLSKTNFPNTTKNTNNTQYKKGQCSFKLRPNACSYSSEVTGSQSLY